MSSTGSALKSEHSRVTSKSNEALLIRKGNIRLSLVLALVLSSSSVVSAQPVAKIQSKLKAGGDEDQALAELMQILSREKENVEAHILTGKLLRKKGFERLADEQFRLADQLDPCLPDSKVSRLRSKLNAEGKSAALSYLQQLEQINPQDPSLLVMHGIIEENRKNGRRAEEYFQKVLEEHPEMPGLSSTIAFIYLEKKNYRKALALAERDLTLKKDHPFACLVKGEALLSLGHSREALPYLQSAFNAPEINRRRASEALSRAYIANGLYGEALEPTLTCLAYTPEGQSIRLAEIKNNLAFILDNRGSNEILNVLKVVQKHIAEPRMKSRLNSTVGALLVKKGFVDEPLKLFQEAARLNPQDSELYGASMMDSLLKRKQARHARFYKQDLIRDRNIAQQIKDFIRQSKN